MTNPWELRSALINLPRKAKALLLIVYDLLACALSTTLFFAIELSPSADATQNIFEAIIVSTGLFMPIAIYFGLYRMIVRFIGWRSCLRLCSVITLYAGCLMAAHFFLPKTISFTYAFIQPVFLLFIVLGSRSGMRYVLDHALFDKVVKNDKQARALIYGAGSAGRQLANSLIIDGEIHVVGFVDDDPELQACTINGLRIDAPKNINYLIKSLNVSDLYLAIPSLARHKRQDMLAKLSEQPVGVRALPSLAEVVNGKVHVSDLRSVQIEEVLGREVVAPDLTLMNQDVHEKVVLVTGAGGSIGSEIARQVLRQSPRTLILFEQNEYSLYSIEQELQRAVSKELGGLKLIAILGSVTDSDRVFALIRRFGVQTIYHAAAYKHVPLVEKNPLMGVFNNVIGTWRLLDAAERARVETFVLISTDKAVRPTNIMGCTKRVAELILQARQQVGNAGDGQIKMSMVRFGNVLGSSGSVIPAFKAQIQAGGPVTVTHPEIVRYFMTIPEAAQLVIQAGALGNGGEVMVLDMGEPIKIRDLAERMIHLSGLRVKSHQDPEGDIEIIYTGLRPGEKLYEELLIGNNTSPTRHSRICLAREELLPWSILEPMLCALEVAICNGDSGLARELMMELVPEFVPQCENQDWLLKN